jgi:putative ABC transport system permease protein
MRPRESLRFAISGVSANKVRSALTTLGILIGVASVIILVAVGTGSSKSVQESISALGSNTFTLSPSAGGTGSRAGGGGGGGGGLFNRGAATAPTTNTGTQTQVAQLTMDDVRALTDKEQAPDVLGVAPVVAAQSVIATYAGATHTVGTFNGTTTSYLAINDDTIASGAAFTNEDYDQHRRVALVGPTLAKALAGGDGSDLVGKSVQFNGKQFAVVGLLVGKGSTGPQDQDDRVLAPASAVQDTLSGYGSLSSISVKASSADTTTVAQTEAQAIIDSRHHVTAANRDYSVRSASSILSAATSSSQTLTVLLGAVAAISLLVGGIGVMNIMLVTVTERTREIGIRKAIGAAKSDIVGQFLIEAVILSVFGGLVGTAVGLIGAQFEIIGVQPVVAPYSVFLAFGVAVLVGLFFGLYPANRAASLRPIDALRYE